MKKFYIVEQSALSIGGHYFNYTKVIAEAAVKQGYEVIILSNLKFNGSYDIEGVRVVKTFPHTWLESEWRPTKYWATGNFAFDICNALYETDADADDIVLIHTLGNVELKNLLKYFLDLEPNLIGVKFHVLLRYDPEIIFSTFPEFRDSFRRLSTSPSAKKNIIFHCDTDRLAKHYKTITNLNFHVAPIPFQQHPLLGLMANKKTNTLVNKPINIAYIGDARREKNYHYLPKAVSTVLNDTSITLPICFTLQSNFNCEGGEDGMAEARCELESFDSKKVNLLLNQLSSEQYYKLIFEADIILLAYDPHKYRNRSSGILIEAMAAGKPVIVTKGTWMEDVVDSTHSIIISSPDEISSALKKMISNLDEFKEGAGAKQQSMLNFSSAPNFLNHLSSTEKDSNIDTLTKAPHILLLAEGSEYKTPNGTRRIFESQLDYLSGAGYNITVLFLIDKFVSTEQRYEILSHLNRILEPYKIFKVLSAFQGSMNNNLTKTKLGEYWQGNKYSIKFDIEQSKKFDISSDTLLHLRNHRPDTILINYITRYPVLEILGLSGIETVCEIHDIQSSQKALYGNRVFGSRDWSEECKYLNKCDTLISLNHEETEIIHKEFPDKKIITTGCYLPYSKKSYYNLLGIEDIAELIASCSPSSSCFQWESILVGDQPIVQKLWQPSKIDLLFISSNHKPNRDGLDQFLREVYLPFLKDKNINLVIAGTINYNLIAEDLENMEKVYYVGPVDNLSPLYSAAKVAILPIYEGAGRAVKTNEAYAHGIPIVATPMALRGQNYSADSIACANNPLEFANDIQRLVFNPQERLKAAKASLNCYKKYSQPTLYAEKMAEIFVPFVDIDNCEQDLSPGNAEIGPSVFKMNRMIMAWIKGHQITMGQVSDLNIDVVVAKDLFEAYRDVISGRVSIYDIPMFYTHPTIGRTIANIQLRENSVQKFDVFTKTILNGL